MATKKDAGLRGAPTLRKRWAKQACGCPVSVDAEQRRHLIECCAFFRAERFRAAQPGACRQQDVRDAQSVIDAVLDAHRPKAQGQRRPARAAKASSE